MSTDYIPKGDDEFNTYVTTQFIPVITASGTGWGLDVAQVAALGDANTVWGYAWTGFQNAENTFRSATETKNSTRGSLEALIRQAAALVQADPTVTDAQKESLGITVRKKTRTPVGVPSSTPSLARVDTSTRGILRLFIVDASTPESRAKPPGVQGCEIREQIGGTVPTDPNAMQFLAIETRMPYRADFAPTEVGKTVFLAFRWLNTRGDAGPWSEIYTESVPS